MADRQTNPLVGIVEELYREAEELVAIITAAELPDERRRARQIIESRLTEWGRAHVVLDDVGAPRSSSEGILLSLEGRIRAVGRRKQRRGG